MDKPQDPYTIWSKKTKIPLQKSFYGDSWEELAFAEDAAGSLWPPRSYTCSFCRREFRSAQALGGHMNVHRRDRAKLKQGDIDNTDLSRQLLKKASSSLCGSHTIAANPQRLVCGYGSKKFQITPKNIIDHDQRGQTFNSSFPDSSSSGDIICQDSCTFVFSSNPNLEDRCIDFSSPSLASRVSVQERSFFPISLSQIRVINQEHTKRANADRDHKDERSGGESDGSQGSVWAFETRIPRDSPRKSRDLMVNLNLARFKEDQMGSLCKRRRIHEPEELPSSSCKIINDLGSMEDLDLELRLGANPPKVNR